LWMFNRDYINPQHPRLAEVATLLEITADAIILWDDAYNEPEGKSIAQLVATVQSALRVSVQAVNVQDNWFDSDQKAVYQELKYYGEREQHYLQHMRLNDAAEPTQHAYYRQQLDTLQQTVQDRRNADKQRQTQRNKLRFHVAKLLERPNNAPHEWQRVLASLEPFWQGDDDDPHLPPDIRVDVRPLLRLQNTPSLDDETRDWFETISAVFEDMAAEDADVDNKTLSRESAKSSSHPLHDTTISADVHRLAPYLEGRTVVIIGGDPKTRNSAVLEQHFNCRIDWIKTNAHQSIYSFQSNLIRDDVILVALLIRWSSHVFGEVKSMCDDHNKLFVRLPRGYSVNMFAHEVIGQVGDRLGM